jgi:hypothetical protein
MVSNWLFKGYVVSDMDRAYFVSLFSPKQVTQKATSGNMAKVASEQPIWSPSKVPVDDQEAWIINSIAYLSPQAKTRMKTEFERINTFHYPEFRAKYKNEYIKKLASERVINSTRSVELLKKLNLYGVTKEQANRVAAARKQIMPEDIDSVPYLTNDEKEKVKTSIQKLDMRKDLSAYDKYLYKTSALLQTTHLWANRPEDLYKLEEILTKLGYRPIIMEIDIK